MTHRQCIAHLLSPPAGRSTRRPRRAAGDRERALEHVARCSDCWEIVGLLHELSTGSMPVQHARMAELFGCELVRDELHALAGLAPSEMRSQHSEAARHIGWCFACRDRFAEVLLVERAMARGAFGPHVVTAVAPGWPTVVASAGGTAQEAVGRLVVGLRRAVAAFTAIPEGFLLIPTPALATARGEAAASPVGGSTSGRAAQFTLGDSEVVAEVVLQPEGHDRVGMTVRLTGGASTRRSLHLRAVRTDGETLVARHTMREGRSVGVSGLRPGQYVLEIEEKQPARRFRVRLDVESAA